MFEKIAKRIAASNTVKVKIEKNPNKCWVEYKGQTHYGEWPQDVELGDWENVSGDIDLLNAAMSAWDASTGEEFEMDADELSQKSGGYWVP